MSGLSNICKTYGKMICFDSKGKKVVWIYDYVNNKSRLETEMTKEEIIASEKAKYEKFKIKC